MIWTITGIASFGVLILFEIQKCKAVLNDKKAFNPWFLLGTILLIGSFVGLAIQSPLAIGIRAVVGGLLLLAGVITYVLVLTGGLSQKNYYSDNGNADLCNTGIYGKMRHPGVWCFLICSVGFGLLFRGTMIMALVMAILNLGYTWLQDKYYFPKYIDGYEDYKKEVPYLIPKGR